MKIWLPVIRSWFEGLKSAEEERTMLMIVVVKMGEENPLRAMCGKNGKRVKIVVSEFADQHAGKTVATLRYLDLYEAQSAISYAMEELKRIRERMI